MNKEELLQLRNEILATARDVAVNSDAPAEVKLPILLELARGNDQNADEMLRKAYDMAKGVEDADGKLNALLDILAEVDAKIVSIDEKATSNTSIEVTEEGNSQNNLT